MPIYTYVQILTSFVDKFYFRTFFRSCVQQINTSATSSLFRGGPLYTWEEGGGGGLRKENIPATTWNRQEIL